ncbi:transcription antitermination protein NusB [[Mycoplasma] falconis]|uniref:Transcription antitermination protein NusB n=1 Tax=[Mycoplasma] falconis TaxID=92403 RepID=A0A501X942_9BACT|nr:transcription antitermination factor NusB [[Mycoplasma] falconis]TPE57075.1 transcription antitermination protein NusB [[Mycoplasma] falconis]
MSEELKQNIENQSDKKMNKQKAEFLIKKFNARFSIIKYIYQAELFEKNIDVNEIFENEFLDKWQIGTLNNIASKYDALTKLAQKFLNEDWDWNRISPLTRAIIIYGEYEILINNPKVVINEMINMAKIYIPNNDYKIVNKVLDAYAKQIKK